MAQSRTPHSEANGTMENFFVCVFMNANLHTCVCVCVHEREREREEDGGGVTGGRDGWPGTETVLTTSEYRATLQKGQLCSFSLSLSYTYNQTLFILLSLFLQCTCTHSQHCQDRKNASAMKVYASLLLLSKIFALRFLLP